MKTELSTRPGLKAGEVLVEAHLTNPQRVPVRLTWKSSPGQGCLSIHVRVLKAGSREVVYPNAMVHRSSCAVKVREQVLAARQVIHHGRVLVLPPGRYAVEVRIPGVDSAMNDSSAGYVMVTAP
ncbi:hypothetical protein GCM10008949_51080 [Deinococcus humi]|nr:hypothetical protein GCM10008949_51080 [Deinococcus humi]